MACHVGFWELDADGEALDDEDDARELDGDNVDVAPLARVDEVCRMRAKDDAKDGGHGRLANVHALLDEGRDEHEDCGEGAQQDVDQMGSRDGEVIPRHGGGGGGGGGPRNGVPTSEVD